MPIDVKTPCYANYECEGSNTSPHHRITAPPTSPHHHITKSRHHQTTAGVRASRFVVACVFLRSPCKLCFWGTRAAFFPVVVQVTLDGEEWCFFRTMWVSAACGSTRRLATNTRMGGVCNRGVPPCAAGRGCTLKHERRHKQTERMPRSSWDVKTQRCWGKHEKREVKRKSVLRRIWSRTEQRSEERREVKSEKHTELKRVRKWKN